MTKHLLMTSVGLQETQGSVVHSAHIPLLCFHRLTHIFLYLLLLQLRHIVDGLPCVDAIRNAEAKGEVVCPYQLVLHKNGTVRAYLSGQPLLVITT